MPAREPAGTRPSRLWINCASARDGWSAGRRRRRVGGGGMRLSGCLRNARGARAHPERARRGRWSAERRGKIRQAAGAPRKGPPWTTDITAILKCRSAATLPPRNQKIGQCTGHRWPGCLVPPPHGRGEAFIYPFVFGGASGPTACDACAFSSSCGAS
jgi:hypothetical protein